MIFCLHGSYSVGFCVGAVAFTSFMKPLGRDGSTTTDALGQTIDYGAGEKKYLFPSEIQIQN